MSPKYKLESLISHWSGKYLMHFSINLNEKSRNLRKIFSDKKATALSIVNLLSYSLMNEIKDCNI